MLELENVNTYYADSHVLWDLSLKVPPGSSVAMLGRNGMGKTTIIRSIMGLTPPRDGVVRYKGEPINGLQPYQIARKGIALVPQGRGVFASLTVKENLTIGARPVEDVDTWNLDEIYSLFPILRDRSKQYANLLSGGEQQMLAVARALMRNPDVLLMDEPSEGLAPIVISDIGRVICRLKGRLTVFLAEQNFSMAMSVADYIYIVSKGSVVWEGPPDDLRNNEEVKQRWLGV
ncbi:MAG: ABC transporter ATP-binding protein [Actinobacteria bacterium]|nr:ABC transporter ATP-binding protein [Actinomycetota bacterium]